MAQEFENVVNNITALPTIPDAEIEDVKKITEG
jgi:hypothetical protein